jgi:hypothetical protein
MSELQPVTRAMRPSSHRVRASFVAIALALGLAGPSAAAVVDITSLNGSGTTVLLGAGTYRLSYAGVSGGGADDAWNPWTNVSGCDSSGMNCTNGWLDAFAIDFGHGVGSFDRQDGFQFGHVPSAGDNGLFATAAQALAAYSAYTLDEAPLPQAGNPGAYSSVGGPVTFTLSGAQLVNFFILDDPYGDNTGGVSLKVSAGVPEPATWAMMITGLFGAGAVLRRRRSATALA